jgi:hypothetical protein
VRVYISGPITGKPDGNREAFNAAALDLRQRGHVPINPQDLPTPILGVNDYKGWMRQDIRALCDCDAILMLPGWSISEGAKLERKVAKAIGLIFL